MGPGNVEALWLANVTLSLAHEPGNQFLSLLEDLQQQKPHALFPKRFWGIKCQCYNFYFSSSGCWLVLIVTLAQSRIIRK